MTCDVEGWKSSRKGAKAQRRTQGVARLEYILFVPLCFAPLRLCASQIMDGFDSE